MPFTLEEMQKQRNYIEKLEQANEMLIRENDKLRSLYKNTTRSKLRLKKKLNKKINILNSKLDNVESVDISDEWVDVDE